MSKKRTWGIWKEKKYFDAGGAGTIYIVENEKNETAILKRLNEKDRGKEERFIKEVEVLNEINHNENNGIINILDSYQNYPNIENDLWYVVPKGIPCKKYLSEIKKQENSANFLFFIIEQGILLFETLEFLHQKNIAHRDIKPENVVWDTNRKRFVFIDFGIAKHQDYEIEHNLKLTEINDKKQLGPKNTIAPEMRQTPIFANPYFADVYSLTKTLWLMITGEIYAFEGQYNNSYDYIDFLHGNINERRIILENWEQNILDDFFIKNTQAKAINRLSAIESKEYLQHFMIMCSADMGFKYWQIDLWRNLNILDHILNKIVDSNIIQATLNYSKLDIKILDLFNFIKAHDYLEGIEFDNNIIIYNGINHEIKNIIIDYQRKEDGFVNIKLEIITEHNKYVEDFDSIIFEY